jgi:DNA-binding transcriptional MerR regulator
MARDQIQIGEVAERTGLSINTIRHYDQAGLVVPSARSQGGFRLYTDSDVERLLLIRRMKPLGFSLEQMRELLDTTDRLTSSTKRSATETARLRDVVTGYRLIAQSRRDQLAAELAFAQEFLGTLDTVAPPKTKRTRAHPARTSRPTSRR